MQTVIPDHIQDLFDRVEAQRVGCGHGQGLDVPDLPGLDEVASAVLRSHAGFTDNPEALFTAFNLPAATFAPLLRRHEGLFRSSGFGQPRPQALLEALSAVPDLLADVDLYACTDGGWALDTACAYLGRMISDDEFTVLHGLFGTCSLMMTWPETRLDVAGHPQGAGCEDWTTAFMWTGAEPACTGCPGHWQLGPGADAHYSPWV